MPPMRRPTSYGDAPFFPDFGRSGSSCSSQSASGLLAQCFQVYGSLSSCPIRELPCRIAFQPGLLAYIILGFLAQWTALDIIHVLKRGAEHLLLVRTVQAPPGAIHLHTFCTQTPGEAVQCGVWFTIKLEVIDSPRKHREDQSSNKPYPLGLPV